MNKKTCTLSMLMLLSSACFSVARQARNFTISDSSDIVTKNSNEDNTDLWWGYFDGDYSNVIKQGVGGGMPYPLTNNCAIRLERTNTDILGKRIKAVRFAFMNMDFIEDVKVWMSSVLPIVAEDADIYCQSVDISSLSSIGDNFAANEFYFDKPYQFGGSDVYVGYSFTVTSNLDDLNTYPVMVSETETSDNGFFYDWGLGWKDYSGSEFGNLALMVLLDDKASFAHGDANYDSRVNVGDVSTTIEYILGGNVNPFNKEMADIDGNGEINIVDAASIADIVLGKYKEPGDKHVEYLDDEVIVTETNGSAVVNLVADNEYKAFQMDVVLPAGKEITSVCINEELASTHILRYERVVDGRYRIVVYSASGESLDGGIDNLLTINTTSAENFKIKNIIFAASDLSERRFKDASYSHALGIGGVSYDIPETGLYTINGVKTNSENGKIGSGLYIKKGKKIIVR